MRIRHIEWTCYVLASLMLLALSGTLFGQTDLGLDAPAVADENATELPADDASADEVDEEMDSLLDELEEGDESGADDAGDQDDLDDDMEDPPTANDCLTFERRSILAISTDLTPRDADGNTLAADKVPQDCARTGETVYHALELTPYSNAGALRYGCPAGARFAHHPLYFEEPCLERCGQYHCRQAVVSALNFYGAAFIMPLKMWHLPPRSCVCGGCY